jgi:Leucine-rich repeat (LRR) protein
LYAVRIQQLRSLTSLNLSLCNITAVPSYICYLHALERLTLIGNKLTRCAQNTISQPRSH